MRLLTPEFVPRFTAQWQIPAIFANFGNSGDVAALPKIRVRRDNICLTGTYLVPLEPRTLLTNS
jgi:hypothetical protein